MKKLKAYITRQLAEVDNLDDFMYQFRKGNLNLNHKIILGYIVEGKKVDINQATAFFKKRGYPSELTEEMINRYIAENLHYEELAKSLEEGNLTLPQMDELFNMLLEKKADIARDIALYNRVMQRC